VIEHPASVPKPIARRTPQSPIWPSMISIFVEAALEAC
jgi:hypothetical protein